MDFSATANIVSAVAVVIGLGFERMEDREADTPPVPANIEHRAWRPGGGEHGKRRARY